MPTEIPKAGGFAVAAVEIAHIYDLSAVSEEISAAPTHIPPNGESRGIADDIPESENSAG